jgi:hypothetical protein
MVSSDIDSCLFGAVMGTSSLSVINRIRVRPVEFSAAMHDAMRDGIQSAVEMRLYEPGEKRLQGRPMLGQGDMPVNWAVSVFVLNPEIAGAGPNVFQAAGEQARFNPAHMKQGELCAGRSAVDGQNMISLVHDKTSAP